MCILSFLITDLLTYNSHAIQFTQLNSTFQWFLVYLQSYAAIPTVSFRIFLSFHKRNPIPISSHYQFLPRPLLIQPQITINLLSLWICLFCICHTNQKHRKYSLLCLAFFSEYVLKVYLVTLISTSFHFSLTNNINHILFNSSVDGQLSCFCFLAVMINAIIL